jgi:TRAP-type C4-dicarboxylate transport system permease large subunit
MLGIAYIFINFITYGRKQEKTKEPFKIDIYFVNIAKETWHSMSALLMPVIIFYGIYG